MINETIQGGSAAVHASLNYLQYDLLKRITDIFNAPFKITNMLWMLLPLLATLILMEFYFGRYKEEELGWNTAFGNALVLIFVSIDLFRHVYDPVGGVIFSFLYAGHAKIIISIVVFLFGILLLFMDFFHFIPKKVAYLLSSPIYINLISLFGIIIVYSDNIPLDWTTLCAFIIIFAFANVAAQIIYWVVPSYKPPLQRILTVEDVEEFGKNKI
jgi:hypothetical protein